MTRLRKALLLTGLGLALAVAAGLVWREALVEAAARRLLAANGFGEARLEVVEVGAAAIVAEDLSLGAGLPEARRLRLAYDLRELISGRLRALEIEGLRYAAPADWTAALAPLRGLAAGGGGGLALSRIGIEDAVVTLTAPLAGSVAVDGTLDLTGARPGAALEVALDLHPLSGAFTLRSEALGSGGAVQVSGGGEAALAGLALPGGVAEAGRARFSLEGMLPIPAPDAGWRGLAGNEALALAGALRIEGARLAAIQGVLAADIGWTLSGRGAGLRLALPRPARLALAGLEPGTLAVLGLPAPGDAPRALSAELAAAGPLLAWAPAAEGGTAELVGDLTLSLGEARAALRATARAEHDAAWRLRAPLELALDVAATDLGIGYPGAAATLARAEWSATGSLGADGAVSLDGPLALEALDLGLAPLHAAALTAEGSVGLSARPGGWTLRAAPGLAVEATGPALSGRLALDGPLHLDVERLELARRDGPASLDLLARTGPAAGTLNAAEPLAFTEAAGRIGLTVELAEPFAGEARLEDGRVTLPGYRLALADLAGRLPLAGAGEDAGAALDGAARDLARPPRFVPIQFTLTGRRDGDTLTLAGEARAGAARLPVALSADLAAVTGRLTAGPGRLGFRPGGLQPGDLSPRLAALGEVDGAVRVDAEAVLGADGRLRTGASLGFDDLAVRRGDLEVAGLAGRLRLARLFPLATAGAQELTARRLTAGVPLDRPRARFTAEARARGLRLEIHEAAGTLAGGTVALEEALWDGAAESNSVLVRVRDVPLDRLLSDWRIEGIDGTGRLGGVIPVRIGPAGIAVADGRLDAAGPGVIRVDWGSARETLVNSGEQVALTVRALEDFRYESLSVGVDRPADGALTLAIGLEGANPAVLDGHPFRFNIALSGQLEPILAAVREGRRISADLLRGGLAPAR